MFVETTSTAYRHNQVFIGKLFHNLFVLHATCHGMLQRISTQFVLTVKSIENMFDLLQITKLLR